MVSQRPVLFLVGTHGSGKTTLGRALKDHHGWRHLSVGDLGRLGRRGKLPREVSLRLMLAIAHSKPGQHIDPATATLLLAQVDAWRRDAPVVVDGFPSLPDHLVRMPKRSGIVHVRCAESIREPRLLLRSEVTMRRWTPGIHSARDLALDEFASQARKRPSFTEVGNDGDLDELQRSADGLNHWANSLA